MSATLSMTPCRRLALRAAALCLVGGAAHAQALPVPQNVASLSASASVEVPKDWLAVTFSTTKEGSDAGAVQAQLKQALDAALTEARKLARPGQVEVQTGAFSLMPRYAPSRGSPPAGNGPIVGWQGTAELIVEGRDQTAIAQLTARIPTMSIARVAGSLSREAREKVEAEVTAQAIARFRTRAEAVSKQFGFTAYAVREVSVSFEGVAMPQVYMRAAAARVSGAEEALPVEAGKATVTVNVNGSVQMK